MLFHGLLAVLLLLSKLLVGLVTSYEFGSDFLGGGEFTLLQPGVCHDIRDREALVGVEVEHSGHQVLELLVEEAFRLALLVQSPELLAAIRGDQLVMRIFHVSHVEGRMAGIQDEEDDTEGEQIDNLALVRLLGVNLRSHEAERANN